MVEECFRSILSEGGKVFFTDINEVKGEETRESLVAEFGAGNVSFKKQV